MAKPALGRGLSALLSGRQQVAQPLQADEPLRLISVDQIKPSSLQPRKDFPENELQELADSIREKGLIQPIVVRPRDNHYELIAGERRWRAARLAGLTEIPALIKEVDDQTALEIILVENLQRADLDPIEEAEGYKQLMERFGLKQEEIARRVGKNRSTIANALRLLQLPESVQAMIRAGKLSAGHAKAILSISDPISQEKMAQRVVQQGLSVRQTEQAVAQLLRPSYAKDRPETSKTEAGSKIEAYKKYLEDRLQERLGTRVTLHYRGGKGKLEIHFFSDEDLERVLELLGIRTVD